MKILHINSFFNGSMFYKNLYDQQLNKGLDIEVYVPVPKKAVYSNDNMGDYTTISPNHGKYDRVFFHLKQYKILKDIINKYVISDFTIIHAHSLFSNGYIALKLKEKYNVPYVVAVRNTDLNYFFKKMPHLRKTGIKILKEAKSIITLSESYKKQLIENYIPNNFKEEISSKTVIIPNGISDFWYQNIGTKKTLINKDEIKLLQVGVIDKNKNITTTVEAIEILNNIGYNIRLTLVGKVKDEKIYTLVKDLPYVNYVSPKAKEDLISIYRENDVFIMPSITETFGLVYVEAMSQGLPIIYSRGQGFDNQFNNGDVGYSVDSLNTKEIVEKIINIINNYDEISSRCIELCTKFMWEKVSRKYTKIYGE